MLAIPSSETIVERILEVVVHAQCPYEPPRAHRYIPSRVHNIEIWYQCDLASYVTRTLHINAWKNKMRPGDGGGIDPKLQ